MTEQDPALVFIKRIDTRKCFCFYESKTCNEICYKHMPYYSYWYYNGCVLSDLENLISEAKNEI